jgi:hypothetical protein
MGCDVKRVTEIAILSLIGIMVLTACLAGNSTTLLIDSETQVNEPAETSQGYGNSEAAIYMSSDYDLTLEVGPPQFLNFYADW